MWADFEIFKSDLSLNDTHHFSVKNTASFVNAIGGDDLFGVSLVEWSAKRSI
jgi:hypothetical protein